MTTVGALQLSNLLLGVLDAIPAVNVFDGTVDLPAYDPADPATHAFWDLDAGGRPVDVHAYAVLYATPGHRQARTIAPLPTNVAAAFQVTCVGADRTRALWCVDKVTTALTGRTITIPGRRGTGVILEPGDTGPLRIDRDVNPHRFYSPLDFAVYL